MTSSSNPFGMRAIYSPSGIVRPYNGQIKSGYASDIFQNMPVRYGLSGDSGSVEGYCVPAAAGERIIGTFMGVEFVDATGRQRVSNYWPASTTGTNIIAYFSTDPTIVYEIQANATLAIATIGQQYDIDGVTGNTTTGFSTASLNVASAANNAQLRVIGISNYVNNAWGDTYPIVQVQISEHQNIADRASY
jgi:hypothetical protein